jgi:Domain of unknown function (DUF6891)
MSTSDGLESTLADHADPPAMSARDRYDAAVATLNGQGIPVHIDTENLSAGDAWCRHTVGTDGRVAVAWEPGGFWHSPDVMRWHEGHRGGQIRGLYFSYPFRDTSVAGALVDAFQAQGFHVEWSGDPTKRVIVHLARRD